MTAASSTLMAPWLLSPKTSADTTRLTKSSAKHHLIMRTSASAFMIITGRVPGDMIYKAAKVGLPIVASVAAVLKLRCFIGAESQHCPCGVCAWQTHEHLHLPRKNTPLKLSYLNLGVAPYLINRRPHS